MVSTTVAATALADGLLTVVLRPIGAPTFVAVNACDTVSAVAGFVVVVAIVVVVDGLVVVAAPVVVTAGLVVVTAGLVVVTAGLVVVTGGNVVVAAHLLLNNERRSLL